MNADPDDIGDLVILVPEGARPPVDRALASALTDYAVAGRYPGSPDPSREDAREALQGAVSIREWVRARLPPGALDKAEL